MKGKLFLVSTPIGNLADITLRALESLKEADYILCEDTRQTLKLLNSYRISKKLISYHQHSKEKKTADIVEKLKNGAKIALVTDSGTPNLSDPGGALVAEARNLGVDIEVLPGASALTAAVALSGFDLSNFTFYGFLPQKKGRQKILKEALAEKRALVFYESPYRICRLLSEIQELGGDRTVFVGRELTKKFEETYSGRISEVLPKIKAKGEFVVILKKGKNER